MVHIRDHVLHIYNARNWVNNLYESFVKCYLTDNIDTIYDLFVVYHSSTGLSIVPQSNSPDVFNMIVQKYARKMIKML